MFFISQAQQLANENADLHKSCDFVLKNFEIRQTARGEEIEALQQAKEWAERIAPSPRSLRSFSRLAARPVTRPRGHSCSSCRESTALALLAPRSGRGSAPSFRVSRAGDSPITSIAPARGVGVAAREFRDARPFSPGAGGSCFQFPGAAASPDRASRANASMLFGYTLFKNIKINHGRLLPNFYAKSRGVRPRGK